MSEINTAYINEGLRLHIETLFPALGINVNDLSINEREARGIAPCHGDADNPTAFVYYFDTGCWRCWTNGCNKDYGSDLIGLIRAVKKCSFLDSIDFANKVLEGKEVPQVKLTNIIRHYDYWKDHLSQKVYKESTLRLLKSAEKYARMRKIDHVLFQEYGIGFAVNGTMCNRIVVPVRNIESKIVGFTGRHLYKKEPKWYHHGFKKNINLFNIDRAKGAIAQQKQVIICEGPFDVLKLRMAGFHNSVAIFGTDIAQGQVNLLCRCGALSIILSLDNDDGGNSAIKRVSHLLERNLFAVTIKKPKEGQDFGDMSIEEIKEVLE